MAVGPSPHTSNRKVTFTQHTHFQIPRSHAHNIHRWESCASGPHYKFCSHQLRSVFCHNKVAMAALNGCYGCHNKMAMATETSLVMLHSMWVQLTTNFTVSCWWAVHQLHFTARFRAPYTVLINLTVAVFLAGLYESCSSVLTSLIFHI